MKEYVSVYTMSGFGEYTKLSIVRFEFFYWYIDLYCLFNCLRGSCPLKNFNPIVIKYTSEETTNIKDNSAYRRPCPHGNKIAISKGRKYDRVDIDFIHARRTGIRTRVVI